MFSSLVIAAVMNPFISPVKVEVRDVNGQYTLYRNGQPYFVNGVGGHKMFPVLQELGANSVRTWGADNLGSMLDEAHKHNISVTVGIWMNHDLDWSNESQVNDMMERARKAVMDYRSHPAVLMWAIGNEMDLANNGENDKMWEALQAIAVEIRRLDPSRPRMVVTADIGGGRIPGFNKFLSAVDIHGVNTYGGAVSLNERYRRAGGKKPVILTEFGPNGVWEIGDANKTPWGAAIEATSTAKEEMYRKSYEGAVIGMKGLSLGSYAFLWGNKQETTNTWFGMLLADGTRTGSVDVMSQFWTGRRPKNVSPRIGTIEMVGGNDRRAGEQIQVRLNVSDPDGDTLTAEWEIQSDDVKLLTAGKDEQVMPRYNQYLRQGDTSGTTLQAPTKPGIYRIFVYIRDGKGSGATANIPFRVQ
ncbi:MAG: hypothetical protein MUC92_05940 [Fimbriimonadaceae bacterium]|jgi:hypothetical protein|nr:hypothetical protein [Fimbriimonadaceae bacterium]